MVLIGLLVNMASQVLMIEVYIETIKLPLEYDRCEGVIYWYNFVTEGR